MARVVHFEIQADQPERAISFYSSVFDWEFTRWSEDNDYWHIKTGSSDEPGIDGGLMKRPAPINGDSVIAFVCTVSVTPLKEYINRIVDAGGRIVVDRMALTGVGWISYAKDTEGNFFAIMEADRSAG